MFLSDNEDLDTMWIRLERTNSGDTKRRAKEIGNQCGENQAGRI
jgi:hypothetical protein